MSAPNYVFEGTEEQKAYAAEMVNNRLRSESRLLNAKAGLWWLSGAGVLLALLGLGVGLGFWGYARYADVSSTADKLADTLAQVLSKVTVEAKGEVSLRDGEMVLLDANGQTVKVEPGGTVALQPGGIVARQPGGTVRVEDGPAMVSSTDQTFKPTQRQLYGSNPTPEQLKEVVEFTRFTRAQYGKGTVHTGWNYQSSRDDAPSEQYCYYIESNPGVGETKINLAQDGVLIPGSSDMVNKADAARFCRWFDSSATKMTANAPVSTPAVTGPAPKTGLSRPMPPPGTATAADWRSWCKDTYPDSIQNWCMTTFAPTNPRPQPITEPAPAQPPKADPKVPVVNERLRMDPVQRKVL
ncbi:hypothetical protein KHP60_16015 [Microvirga sp. 3-52]|uniref:hypothetical protein n=1 Tax=Microvirga sp. 3-52 TaxID=2792425 RepID=UPI001AC13F71|nr:hypothetical protein [Microvirga sp. 3-52]MBO1906566.1 hypothetical protein [Microvirga sp. 3-52]MBS7453837.1 hypothetical protein [Microvirga sp. 3-52]